MHHIVIFCVLINTLFWSDQVFRPHPSIVVGDVRERQSSDVWHYPWRVFQLCHWSTASVGIITTETGVEDAAVGRGDPLLVDC